VPTYEYQCDACQRVFEIRQRISEEPLTVCDVCGGHVRRLLSPAPFILKGDGWYVTDYPSESRKKAMESEKSATPAAASTEKTSAEKSASDKASEKSTGSSASSSASAPASPTTSTSD
jgi:putative FmdB family regulatory protein